MKSFKGFLEDRPNKPEIVTFDESFSRAAPAALYLKIRNKARAVHQANSIEEKVGIIADQNVDMAMLIALSAISKM